MSMQLLSITDPRDNLEKARRIELVRFAAEHGITDVKPDMPAILIRKILRSRNLTNIRVSARKLGQPGRPDAISAAPVVPEGSGIQMSMEEDLARQYAQQNAKPPTESEVKRDRPLQEMTKLRRLCKQHGIKVDRTDNLATLRYKLRDHGGENPA
jgi:hypothetical protein